MLFSGANPTHALIMFSNIALCFESAFTTGVPGGTCYIDEIPMFSTEFYVYNLINVINCKTKMNILFWGTSYYLYDT